MLSRIGAVILLVSDMDRSIKFYRDVLGMELKQESDDWTEFSKSGTVLALHPTKKKGKVKVDKGLLVGFNVSDIKTVYSELKKKQVKFYKKLTAEKFGKHAVMQDPDGHLISIVEMTRDVELAQTPFYHGFAPI